MKKILLASTSTIHGGLYLEYLLPELEHFFKEVSTILFIPFARPSGKTYQEYTLIVNKAFNKINKKVVGIHEFSNYKEAIHSAEGIFTGGGNTFELLTQLYNNQILDVLRKTVENGTPYLGTSAGTNICGLDIKTTNDMPIVYPPSFEAMKLVPFNINPHYLDPIKGLKHMGETRETRINEFHVFNSQPVLGIREGSWLMVNGDEIILKGSESARIFKQKEIPEEIETGSVINTYLG